MINIKIIIILICTSFMYSNSYYSTIHNSYVDCELTEFDATKTQGLKGNINVLVFNGKVLIIKQLKDMGVDDKVVNGKLTLSSKSKRSNKLTIREISFYNNGIKNGPEVKYNKKGKIISRGNYYQDKKHGKFIVLDDEGKKLSEFKYKKGVKK